MKKTALVLSIMLLTNIMGNVVYANTPHYIIDKTTINGLHSATRQSQVKDIIITEQAPGLFEKDKTIYLKADRLFFCTSIRNAPGMLVPQENNTNTIFIPF